MATIASFRAHGCCVQSQYRFTLSRLYTQTRVWPQFPFVDGASDHSFISGPWILRLITVSFHRFAPMYPDACLATVQFLSWIVRLTTASFRAHGRCLFIVSFCRFVPFTDVASGHSFVSRLWCRASRLHCLHACVFFPSMPLSLIVSEYVFKQTMAHLND